MLETVRDAPGSYLAKCYGYEVPTAQDEYPFATVVPVSSSEQELDTYNDQAEHVVRIRAVDLDRDKAVQEDRMRHLYDGITAELRKKSNATLGGIAARVVPIESTWGWESNANVQARTFEITVRVTENVATQ